jgi:hypothetical protein
VIAAITHQARRNAVICASAEPDEDDGDENSDADGETDLANHVRAVWISSLWITHMRISSWSTCWRPLPNMSASRSASGRRTRSRRLNRDRVGRGFGGQTRGAAASIYGGWAAAARVRPVWSQANRAIVAIPRAVNSAAIWRADMPALFNSARTGASCRALSTAWARYAGANRSEPFRPSLIPRVFAVWTEVSSHHPKHALAVPASAGRRDENCVDHIGEHSACGLHR